MEPVTQSELGLLILLVVGRIAHQFLRRQRQGVGSLRCQPDGPALVQPQARHLKRASQVMALHIQRSQVQPAHCGSLAVTETLAMVGDQRESDSMA